MSYSWGSLQWKETIDWDKNGYYLVYEDGSEMEFELYIQETEDGKYEVIITEQEDPYYDKAFNTIDEVALTLYKEHSFVKQLRCSSR